MRRRAFFTFCSAVSLLLCAAVCVLWVRSWIGDGESWDYIAPSRQVMISSSGGSLGFSMTDRAKDPRGSAPSQAELDLLPQPFGKEWSADASSDPGTPEPDEYSFVPPDVEPGWTHRRPGHTVWLDPNSRLAGLGFGRGSEFSIRIRNGDLRPVRDLRYQWLVVPHWTLVLTLALLPACRLGVAIYRREGRRRPGSCLGCGYDLRATPERCPECGRAPVGTTP